MADKTAEAVEGTLGERPVHTTIQAFSWVDGTPTPEEVRTQLFQSFMGGAKGLGYYTWEPHDENVDEYLNKGRYWDMITSFANCEQQLLFDLYNDCENKRLSSYRSDRLWYDSFVHKNHIYTVVLNRAPYKQTAEINLTLPSGEPITEDFDIATVNGEGISEVAKQEASFIIPLKAYQAAIYEITPEDSKMLFYEGDDWVTVYASGLDGKDRVYIALYDEGGEEKQLKDIKIISAEDNQPVICKIDNKEGLCVKAFIWSGNMKPKLKKTGGSNP